MLDYITVRERVCTQIEKNMGNLVDADNNFVFHSVSRAPIVDANFGAPGTACLGIVDLGDLNVEYQVGYIMPTLRLGFEFGLTLMEGDNPSRSLNSVLGMITRALIKKHQIIEDTTQAELTLDIKYVSFEPDITDYADRVVSGVAIFDILYRFDGGDPTILM